MISEREVKGAFLAKVASLLLGRAVLLLTGLINLLHTLWRDSPVAMATGISDS